MLLRLRLFPLVALLAGTLSGCAVLVGSVKPTEERAATETYRYLHLDERPGWSRLAAEADAVAAPKAEPAEPSPGASPATEGSPEAFADVAYQSADDGAIISLNSSCRADKSVANPANEARQLREFSDLLLLGVTAVKFREETFLDLVAGRALQTTVRGEIDGRLTTLRTVVIRRGTCVFDLMLVAQPKAFVRHESTFDEFIRAFRPRTP